MVRFANPFPLSPRDLYLVAHTHLARLKASLLIFWRHYPALHLSLLFLAGMGSTFHPLYLLIGLLLLGPNKRGSLLVLGSGFFYFLLLCPDPPLTESLRGNAYFHIKEVKKGITPFKPFLIYEGTLLFFQGEDKTFHRLPCRLYSPVYKKKFVANHDYLLSNVSLSKRAPYQFLLKVHPKTSWKALEKTKNPAQKHFERKEKVSKWVRKTFRTKPVCSLIGALLTGNKESYLQTYQFGQVGLQHLLAISGFHFALLSLFLNSFLRLLLPRKARLLGVILLLSLYFYYMGDAPSVSRAYVGALALLVGLYFDRVSRGLNALGIGLMTALALNPLVLLNAGFQLSFAATGGILLLYFPCEQLFQKLFPKRSFQTLRDLPLPDQLGSLISSYLRKMLALNLALLPFTLPLILFHFKSFPLMSLVYNLFFPLLFSILIALLLFAFLLPYLFPFLESYANFLLHLIAYTPKRFSFSFFFPSFSHTAAILFFFLFFLYGLFLHSSSWKRTRGGILT